MEVNQGNSDEIETKEEVQMPDVLGKNLEESEKIIKDNGLEMIIQNEQEQMDYENTVVKNQIPKAGIMINKGSKVYIEY